MADDLDANWKQDHTAIMPALKKHWKEGGIEFTNHVAAVPAPQLLARAEPCLKHQSHWRAISVLIQPVPLAITTTPGAHSPPHPLLHLEPPRHYYCTYIGTCHMSARRHMP